MKTIEYTIEEEYDTFYRFYLDGKLILESVDMPYEDSSGWSVVNALKCLEQHGLLSLELLSANYEDAHAKGVDAL